MYFYNLKHETPYESTLLKDEEITVRFDPENKEI